MDTFLTVKDFAQMANKSEETIKRYIRAGKLPNAVKESDKKGWRIPKSDINCILSLEHAPTVQSPISTQSTSTSDEPHKQENNQDTRELVNLAFQAVTMTSPTEEILGYLSYIGIKRTLELLLCMQQSPNKVRNVEAFLKKGIAKGWTPTTVPIKKERNRSRIQAKSSHIENDYTPQVPFYNWLEVD